MLSNLLQGFDNWVAQKVQPRPQVRFQNTIRRAGQGLKKFGGEVAQVPLGFAKGISRILTGKHPQRKDIQVGPIPMPYYPPGIPPLQHISEEEKRFLEEEYIAEPANRPIYLNRKNLGQEIAQIPLGFAKGVGRIVSPERTRAIEESIQTKSFKPLQASFQKQGKELAQQYGGPEGAINLTLSFGPSAIKAPKVRFQALKNLIQPAETVVGRLSGQLKNVLTKTADIGEVEAAKRVSDLMKGSLNKLSRSERFNLFDSLEGRAKPLNEKVAKAFQITRTITDEIGQKAKDIGVQVRRKMTIEPPTKTIPETATMAKGTDPLAQEARKYKSAEEFTKAFQSEIKHGEYWHITDNPSFKINKELGPRDLSSLATGKMDKGKLMVTSDIGYWNAEFPSRKFAAKLDFSQVKPEDYYQVNRGFGNEFFVKDPSKVRVEKVIPIEQAIKEHSEFQKVLEGTIKSKSQLTDFYNKVVKEAETKLPTELTSLQRQKLNEGKAITGRFKVPFEPRANYYPHAQVMPDLLEGGLKTDIAENIVRLKIKPDLVSANVFIDDYKEFIKSGKKTDSLIKYMVETGQSKNAAEALNNLQRFRQRTIKRQGSLEYSREVDLPFYDPDPSRALPGFVASTSKRLEQIKAFGQGNEVINKLILDIRNSGGDADLARTATDKILNMINESATPGAKASRFLRTIQGFKLGLAAIPNSTQGVLNSLLYADLRGVAAGIKGLLTRSGREYAQRSGAALESVVREAGRETGALSKFLKLVGFSSTEQANRIVASNAGRSYGQRLFNTLIKSPDKVRPARILQELGIDVKKALQAGKLSEDDILMMGKKFSDITQFRSRPQDLPLFASTNTGKVFFQFKSFIYGQTRLLHKATIQEIANKNFGRATRNLLILSTIFPLIGEAIADIRSLITGRERKTKGLARYFEDIGQVGALGILSDTLQAGSYGRGTEFIAGPTFSDVGELINIAGGPNKGKNLGKFLTRKIPIVGSRLSQTFFPKKKETIPTGNLLKLR